MTIKYLSYVLFLQVYFMSMIYASDSIAQQYKSVKETYITEIFDNITVNQTFKIIERSSPYSFYFNEDDLNQNVKISYKPDKSTTVAKVLLEISRQAHLKFRQVNNNISVTPIKTSKSKVQNSRLEIIIDDVVISGKVTDEEGNGLPGVNILVKGTTTGSTTDQEGQYNMEVPDGSTLVFSFIGFVTQEIEAGLRTVINVQLVPDLETLPELIVTAFGIEREKKALGYSVQEVKGEDILTEAREVSVVSSLKGRIAGVHVNGSAGGPAGSSYVVIRGNSSLAGNNQPLYVVDGVPIDNKNDRSGDSNMDLGDGISNLNPQDIESITVLKGPNASALYGSRGANGVIQITTKKGRARKGIGISFSSNYTNDKMNVVPKFQNIYGGSQHDDYSDLGTTVIDGKTVSVWPSNVFNHAGGAYDGRDIMLEFLPDAGILKYNGLPKDRIKEFFETGHTFTNNLSFEGGDEKSNYYVSIADMHNSGIVPNNSFSRQSISGRVSSTLNDKFSFDAKLNYIHQSGENRNRGGSVRYNVMPALFAVPSWLPYSAFSVWKYPDGSYRSWKFRPRSPFWIVNELQSDDERDRFIGFLSANYKFTNWLSLQGRLGTDTYSDQYNQRTGIGTPSLTGGDVSNFSDKVSETNADALLTASGNLTNSLSGTLSLGANHRKYKSVTQGIYGKNLDIPDLYHVSNALDITPTYNVAEKEINSVFFIGQLAFKNYLFLDVTGRNDWSSTLSLENQSYFYPSAGLSLAFTDMYDNNSTILTFGKVRVSWAQAGSDASPYQTQAGYSVSTNNFRGLSFGNINNTLPNVDLENELTTSMEFGFDLRFFKNRVGLDFTYYDASTENQIIRIDVPGPSGFARAVVNAGEINNKGWEVTLNATVMKRPGSFQWDMNLNLSNNKSKVISLAPEIETLSLFSSAGMAIEARPGEDFGNIVGYDWNTVEVDGVERLQVNSSGQLFRASEKSVLGNIQPDYLGGLSNTFTYKGFHLNTLLDIRQGGQIFSFTRRESYSRATGVFTENREDLVWDAVIKQEDGSFIENDIVVKTEEYYNAQAWGNKVHTNMVVDASYISFREAAIGYSFNADALSRTPFTNIRLSLVGRNLFYIKRASEFEEMGISPENSFSPTAAAQGIDRSSIPTTRSVGINVSLTF